MHDDVSQLMFVEEATMHFEHTKHDIIHQGLTFDTGKCVGDEGPYQSMTHMEHCTHELT